MVGGRGALVKEPEEGGARALRGVLREWVVRVRVGWTELSEGDAGVCVRWLGLLCCMMWMTGVTKYCACC